MNSLVLSAASLALLVPALAHWRGETASLDEAPQTSVSSREALAAAAPAFDVLDGARETPVQRQVRIEQRVIIRIAPSPEARQRMKAQAPRISTRTQYREERMRGCLPIEGIVGVQPTNDNRLLLFMRDRAVISAALERRCNPQDFYSGAYVERSEDGQLCSGREQLQSRTGAKCEVARLSRLVAVSD